MTTKQPEDFDYQRYLASREWGLLREQVRKRSDNRCEHCRHARQRAVHHLTYDRIGHEKLDDLMAVCNDCHEFLSGTSDINPLIAWAVVVPRTPGEGGYVHLLFGHSGDHRFKNAVPTSFVVCREGCIFCAYVDEQKWVAQAMELLWLSPEALRLVLR